MFIMGVANMSIYVDIFLALILFSTIVVIIAENRHPVKTIAWVLVLFFLPVLGMVLYFFFGMNKRNERLIKDDDLHKLKSNTADLYSEQIIESPYSSHRDLVNLLWTTNMAYPLNGNDAKVYTAFDPMFADLLTDLKTAKDHIHFEFFIFQDDEIGRKVSEILIRKAHEGLDVRVQYDDVSNLRWKPFFRKMIKEGVMVQPFIKVVLPILSRNTNYRNHRKVVVIDGRIGYLGGMNIAERYSTGIRGGKWRDTHMRIEGPAVSEMQTAFLTDWQFSSKELITGLRYYPKVEPCGDVMMQIATSGPMDRWQVIMQGILRMINHSKKYIYIQSPYLIPPESMLLALRNAALSGVDVRLMIPYKGDKGILPPLATRSFVQEVIDAGVKVYFYESGYMHSKAIVSDDKVCTIGSANMDVRSYEQDFEINAFIYDSNVAKILREAFLEDQKICTPVDPVKWPKRGRWARFKESLARIVSPLL